MSTLFAVLPLGVVLIGMLRLRWSAALAGFAALVVALVLAMLFFGFGKLSCCRQHYLPSQYYCRQRYCWAFR